MPGFKVTTIHKALKYRICGDICREFIIKIHDFETGRTETYVSNDVPDLAEIRRVVVKERAKFRERQAQPQKDREAIAALVGKTFEVA